MESQHYKNSHEAYVSGMLKAWLNKRFKHIEQHPKDNLTKQRLARSYQKEFARLQSLRGSYQEPQRSIAQKLAEGAVSATAINLSKAANQ